MSFITSNEVRDYIRKVFGADLNIVEATAPLRMQPIPEDLIGASPRDPSNCVLVHTGKRMYGSQMVLIWKKVAYIDLPNKDGKRQVERLVVTKKATQQLGDFDQGKPFPVGGAIIFEPPPKAQTLRANRKRGKVRDAATKKYIDRRKRLTTIMDKKRKTAKLAADQLQKAKVKANLKKDKAMLVGIKQRKADADAALKAVQDKIAAMDQAREKRAPKQFDLTTRNGAAGNYNFSGPVPLAVLPPEKARGTLIP